MRLVEKHPHQRACGRYCPQPNTLPFQPTVSLPIMSVFTREAFQMSSMPPSANASSTNLAGGSGASTPALEQVAEPHVAEIEVESVLFDVSPCV